MRIGLVLSPSFQAVCFGAVAAFDVANKQAGEKSTMFVRSRKTAGWSPRLLGCKS